MPRKRSAETIAKSFLPYAANLLVRVLKDPKQPTSLRLEAAKIILGYGLSDIDAPDAQNLDQITSLPITSLH